MKRCLHVRKIQIEEYNQKGVFVPGVLGLYEKVDYGNSDDKSGDEQRPKDDGGVRGRALIVQVVTETISKDGVGNDRDYGHTYEDEFLSDDEAIGTDLETLKSYLILEQQKYDRDDRTVERQEQSTPSGMQNTFKLQESNACIKITVLEPAETGQLRLNLWTRTIPRKSRLSSRNDHIGAVATLADMIEHRETLHVQETRKLRNEIQTLQSKVSGIQQACNDWKDTAQKLEGKWEGEKTELLKNFLQLYNAREDYMRSMEEKLKRYEDKEEQKALLASQAVDVASDAAVVAARRPNPKTTQKRQQLPSTSHFPDDQDMETFTDEQVEKLASAPQRPKRAVANKRKASSTMASVPVPPAPEPKRKREATARRTENRDKKRKNNEDDDEVAVVKPVATAKVKRTKDSLIKSKDDDTDETDISEDEKPTTTVERSYVLGLLGDENENESKEMTEKKQQSRKKASSGEETLGLKEKPARKTSLISDLLADSSDEDDDVTGRGVKQKVDDSERVAAYEADPLQSTNTSTGLEQPSQEQNDKPTTSNAKKKETLSSFEKQLLSDTDDDD